MRRCEEGECTDLRKENTMKIAILSIATALMFASPAFAQSISGGARMSASPYGSVYPAPLTNFDNPSVFATIRRR